VHRYSDSGTFLGTLLTDNVNLSEPTGLLVSPDKTKLYIASSQTKSVVRYDYNFAAATATNPTLFADATDGLDFPNSLVMSADGGTIYVSNLGGSGVARFHLDGTSAGAALHGSIGGGAFFQFSGLAWSPTGELLVGAFQNFPAGNAGAVAKSDAGLNSLSDFIAPAELLNGVGNLLVHDNSLYVTAGFTGRVSKHDATTGAVDGAFTTITDLPFTASLLAAPDGNGILVGYLGLAAGAGGIARYGFDGTYLGSFAMAQATAATGFVEPTGMAYVPESSTAIVLLFALAVGRCRRCKGNRAGMNGAEG
jgi:DNA-binding beta-propeller fold protein YncE